MSVELTGSIRPALKPRKGLGERLQAALLELAGGHGTIVHREERAWASITFTGTRHTIRIAFEGEQAVESGERFVAALPDHEFAIPGQLVADAAIAGVDHDMLPRPRITVECELLLLVEA